MSHTTDITLLLGPLDNQGLDDFNAALTQAGVPATAHMPHIHSLAPAVDALPGTKCYTNLIAAACWNNGSPFLTTLAIVFQTYPWESPENAVLVVVEEQMPAVVVRPLTYRGAE